MSHCKVRRRHEKPDIPDEEKIQWTERVETVINENYGLIFTKNISKLST